MDAPRRVLQGLAWEIGRVEHAGRSIYFEPPQVGGSGDRTVKASAHLWKQFVRLRAAEDDTIAAFAADWGPLWLCRHGLPVNRCREDAEPPIIDGPTAATTLPFAYVEDINDWRRWAERLHAVIQVARAVRKGAAVEKEVAARAFERSARPRMGEYLEQASRTRAFNYTSFLLDDLLDMGQVRRRVAFTAHTMAIVDDVSGLFGALAIQVAHACMSVETSAFCRGCREPFDARNDEAKYCANCRGRVDVKINMRRRREALYAKGLTARGTPRIR
jgi:hypothetical protein